MCLMVVGEMMDDHGTSPGVVELGWEATRSAQTFIFLHKTLLCLVSTAGWAAAV